MARSFFTGKDSELYTGSNAFSTKITATPTAYGLVAAQATAYAAKNTAYAAAYVAATDPATRTKGTIAAKNAARAALRFIAADYASIIVGTATVTDEQKLDLGIRVRGTPGPVPPPGTVTGLVVTLAGNGSLNLKWKCKNPKGSVGTLYQVWRKIDDATEFTYIGGTGLKKTVDNTLPAGSTNVTYQIQAVRSSAVGEWAQFNVAFGKNAGGALAAKVSDGTPVKIAA